MKVGTRLSLAGATALFSVVIIAGAAFAAGGSILVPDAPGQVLQTNGVGAATASQNAAIKSLKTAAIASGLSSQNVTLVHPYDAVVVGGYRGSASDIPGASNSGTVHPGSGLDVGTSDRGDESHGGDQSNRDSTQIQIPETPRMPSPVVPTAPAIPGKATIHGTPPAAPESDHPDTTQVNQENNDHTP